MSAVAFDTLKVAQTLRDKARFTSEQAEGLSEVAQASADQLATKSDITGLRSDLKGDIVDLRTQLKADIIELRTELKIDVAELRSDLRESELRLETKIETTKADTLRWMFGTIGFQTIVILGAVLALSRFGH